MRSLLAFLAAFSLACPTQAQKKKSTPLSPIEDVSGLPRALLIGDSISIGYTLPTRELLTGKVNLHRIPANAGHTGMGLANLDTWLEKLGGEWDVIHFNWGLWDLCYRNPESKTQGNRDKEGGVVTHSPEEYAANMERLVEKLKATGATLIFATTTPVPEREAGRKIGDDVIYNRAALAVMEKHGVEVNDLHSVMAGKMDEFAMAPGNVHFTSEGSELLARAVADKIRQVLGSEADR